MRVCDWKNRNWKNEKKKEFGIEFGNMLELKSKTWWGRRYGVSVGVINEWLDDNEVQDIVKVEKENRFAAIRDKVKELSLEALEELAKVMRKAKIDDVKRKACNDILGIANIENVNTEGRILVENQYCNIEELKQDYERIINVTPDNERIN